MYLKVNVIKYILSFLLELNTSKGHYIYIYMYMYIYLSTLKDFVKILFGSLRR